MRKTAFLVLAVLAAIALPVAADRTRTELGTGLSIETAPQGAEVWLNGTSVGLTPYLDTALAPGLYRVTLRKPGFRPRDLTVTIGSAQRLLVYLELEPVMGTLSVRVEPENALILVDGVRRHPGMMMLPEGTHTVTARAFGYQEQSGQVRVSEFFPASVSLVLEQAPLAVSRLGASRPRFNPANPATLGTTTVSFSVSGPGTGEATVTAPDGSTVLARSFSRFSSWNQSFAWNGRDREGVPLADGTYTVEVTARDAAHTATARLPVTIDSGAVIGPRNATAGLPGLELVPAGFARPAGTWSFTARAAGPLPPGVPIPFSFSLAAVPVPALTARAGVVLPVGSSDSYLGASFALQYEALAIRAGGGRLPLALAPAVQATVTAGTATTGTGEFLLPLQLGERPLAFLVAPGIGADEDGGFALLRTGALVESGIFSGGISGMARTGAFGTAPGAGFPARLALEGAVLIPGTGFAPGVSLGLCWTGAAAPAVEAGVRFEMLF